MHFVIQIQFPAIEIALGRAKMTTERLLQL